jgi:hypothetical protein
MTVLPCTLLERVAPAAPARFQVAPVFLGDKLSAPALGLRAILSLPPLPPFLKHPLRSSSRWRSCVAGPPHQGTSTITEATGNCNRDPALVAANFER